MRALTTRAKGGTEVGSRVRIAAAGLLIAACALLIGGIGDAVAYATPVHDSAGADDGDGSRPGSAHRVGTTSRPRAGRIGEARAHAESRQGRPRARKSGERRKGDLKPDHEKRDHEKHDHGERADEKPGDGHGMPIRPTQPAGAGSPNEDQPEADCGQGRPSLPSGPEPGTSPAPANGGGGGGVAGAPAQPVRRPQVPPMRLPPTPRPVTTPHPPVAPIIPLVTAPPPGVVPRGGVPQSLRPVPNAPRGVPDLPADAQPPPRTGNSAGVPPTSLRPGYPEYLRGAGVAEVAAVAGPGLVGILILTGLGALVGYCQAKAGHALRSRRAAKFAN